MPNFSAHPIVAALESELRGGRRCLIPKPKLSVVVAQKPESAKSSLYKCQFLVDTGSDVSLVPLNRAREHRFVGIDPAATFTELSTGLHGSLEGYWGTLTIAIGEKRPKLPCFYYAIGKRGNKTYRWVASLLRRIYRSGKNRRADLEAYPLVIGRAGFLGVFNLLIQEEFLVISDRSIMEMPTSA